MPPPPPRSLPEELVEQILLRFPPADPARLVHAALVCKPWCAIVSGAGFRRMFREFHRTPPLLGFFFNFRNQDGRFMVVDFAPTCSLPGSQIHGRIRNARVVDAHHGRVLLRTPFGCYGAFGPDALKVWDRTTDEQKRVPIPPVARYMLNWTAAVLCAAGAPCDHLDCHQGPFVIVFAGYDRQDHKIVLCTYSSSTASWSKPISIYQLPCGDYVSAHIAHDDNAVYFGARMTDRILKFDLESQEISWIQIPATLSLDQPYVLTTTEGGGLGLANIYESSKLYMWSRDGVSEADATWTQSRVIELKTLLPVHAVLASPRVLGFTVGTGVVFVMSNKVIFAIDLKTYKVIKEVSMESEIYTIIPYMSFYTPAALGAVSISTGEGS